MLKRLSALWMLVRGDARQLWRALRHPAAPVWLKPAVGLLLLYLVWPVDLIPDVIPVLGLADDLVLIPLAVRLLLNRLPEALRRDIGAAAEPGRAAR
jgi:uncharacterized membrane protein YkvA (DUF1232 family)